MGKCMCQPKPSIIGVDYGRPDGDRTTMTIVEGALVTPLIMADEIPQEVRTALLDAFGYVPDERGGEKRCVYQDHSLIVVHPERIPRIYKRGCGGLFYEIVPDFP